MVGLSLQGCGYSVKSTLPGHMNTIHVEPFVNKVSFTTEGGREVYLPLLEVDVRNSIINRYLFDGNLKIADADDADIILSGELKRYVRGGLRYTDDDDVEEYRVHVIVSIRLWDIVKNEEVWNESEFVGEATYFVTGPNASSEDDAIDRAIEDLARRIVARTIEDW